MNIRKDTAFSILPRLHSIFWRFKTALVKFENQNCEYFWSATECAHHRCNLILKEFVLYRVRSFSCYMKKIKRSLLCFLDFKIQISFVTIKVRYYWTIFMPFFACIFLYFYYAWLNSFQSSWHVRARTVLRNPREKYCYLRKSIGVICSYKLQIFQFSITLLKLVLINWALFGFEHKNELCRIAFSR